MRQIVLDTETTGLEVERGHRIIEIGAIELVHRRATGRRFHKYLNPEREIDEGAKAVHGISSADLASAPRFAEIAAELLDFLAGAELVIHNASFDVGFLDNELALAGCERLASICGVEVIDTLRMARDMRPGRKNSLDALCVEFGIDNTNRQWHGALLDAELLAEVYLAMTRGQNSLAIDFDQPRRTRRVDAPRPPLVVRRASSEELAEHARVLAEIAKESKGKCLWQALEGETA